MVMGTGQLVGARVQRVEDPRFLTGQGDYVSVTMVPGMADIAIVRSPYAHAASNGSRSSRRAGTPGCSRSSPAPI
jgi:aerobic carbon-monoxide dehydrogenase large subunit